MSTKELTRPRTSAPEAPVRAASAPAPRRINPFELLQTEIDRVFDTFNGWPAAFSDKAFVPTMQVKETDSVIEVTTELPGMDEKDIDISVTNGVLSIRGEKKTEKDERRHNYQLVERTYGSFQRSVQLPEGVDASKIKATMSKGVLKVEVAKPPAAKAQQVRITAG